MSTYLCIDYRIVIDSPYRLALKLKTIYFCLSLTFCYCMSFMFIREVFLVHNPLNLLIIFQTTLKGKPDYEQMLHEAVKTMKLRYFSPREIANLLCFPEEFGKHTTCILISCISNGTLSYRVIHSSIIPAQ